MSNRPNGTTSSDSNSNSSLGISTRRFSLYGSASLGIASKFLMSIRRARFLALYNHWCCRLTMNGHTVDRVRVSE